MPDKLFALTLEDVQFLRELKRSFVGGESINRPRHQRKQLPFRYPSADGGQCYLGLAVSDIEGCLSGVYSSGSYRYAAMTPTVNPTTLTYESLSDTTKRVTAINVCEYKQLSGKPALIWKQPNGQYLAYPWQRQFSNAKVNGLTFSGLQVSAWTAAAIDGSHPAATTTSVSGVNKGVFKYGFHGTVIGRMTFTMAASGGGVKTGQATITFGWYQKAAESLGGYTLHYPLVQGPGSDGPSVYDLTFAFSCRLLENAYVDTATIGISGGISSAHIGPPECTMEFIANSGMNTPNGFGS